jgi:hypothetical protein
MLDVINDGSMHEPLDVLQDEGVYELKPFF